MENIQIETYEGSGQEVFEDGRETIIVVHEVPNSKSSSETNYVPYKFSSTSDIIIASSSSPNSMPSLSSLTTLPSMSMPSSLTSMTNASSLVLSGELMGPPQLVSRTDSKKGSDSEAASWFSSGSMFSEVRQGTNFVTTANQSSDGSVHLPSDFDSNMVEVMITEKTSIDPKEELDFDDGEQEDEDGGCLVTLHLDSSLFRHCPVCGGIIDGFEDMKQHCENCLGPNMYKIQEHKINKINTSGKRKNRFSCSTCDRKFANKKSFEKHRYWCDPNVLLADYAVAENTDLSSYGVSNLKDEHFIGHLEKSDIKLSTIKEEEGGGAKMKNSERGKVVKKPSHTCPKCAKTFSSPAYMKTHMRIHTGERPFSCNSCGKSFNDRTALRNHDKIHTNERPFSCNTCGKSFRRSDSLKYHAASHTGERPFICAHCAKSFKNQRDLKMHEKCVHGDGGATAGYGGNGGTAIHACNDCNMICESLSSLKFHKRITHGQGKTYDCEYCGKKCLASSQLEIHLRSHTGDKPFKCSHCDKAFRRQSHLQVHEQRHTGYNVFRCTQCNKGFPQKVELKQHEKIHSGQKPYQCGLCGKCFAREDYVRIHMKTHGPAVLPNLAEVASAAIITKQAVSVPTKTVYVMEPDVPGGSGGHSAMLGLAHVRGDKEVGATIVIPAGHSVINSGQHNEIFRQIPGLNVVQDGTVQFKIS